ncbi:MAG TPA: hypothetical protein VK593_02250 [Edaphobacter sp.]|nr:hypothetical protein [Edaphobacter sp.]
MEKKLPPHGGASSIRKNTQGDDKRVMANTLLPIEERNLTPDEVELLDRRRRRGQLFLVIGGQCLIVFTLVTLWAGQDFTLSPGWSHPMVYWDAITGTLAMFFLLNGIRLRRGMNEFLSY